MSTDAAVNGTAVTEIERLAREATAVQLPELGGRKYSDRVLYDPRKPDPEPKPLVVHTLSGLVHYTESSLDGLDFDKIAIHVVDHSRVRLVSNLRGEFEQRFVYAEAVLEDRLANTAGFQFGRWIDSEMLTIALLTLFDQSGGQIADVQSLLANVSAEQGVKKADTGITQEVVTKVGVTFERVAVPNPVGLAPWRTFPEVPQPSSLFAFRVRKTANGAIEAALFEADGGAWKAVAIQLIRTWLQENFTDHVEIIA